MRVWVRCLKWATGVVLALLLSLGCAGWLLLRGSLPLLEGRAELPGLGAEVTVERDGHGRVALTAENRGDVTRALGFLHAQDRFFQMDLARRSAAGELAQLLGEAALPLDRERRLHQGRKRLEAAYAGWDEEARAWLEHYSEGVNAGLEALSTRPWPYLVLRSRPQPWEPVDSLLVGLSMAFALQDERGDGDRMHGVARAAMPESIYNYLFEHPSAFDGSMDEVALPYPPMPSDATWRSWIRSVDGQARSGPVGSDPPIGSNAWAVSPEVSREGRAIVSFDMHLPLRVPNTWYYAAWKYASEEGGEHQVMGLTLPGLPLLIAGSNGSIAWGFTNAYIDTTDLVELEMNASTQQYRSADGWEDLVIETETIEVAGREPDLLPVRLTRWGPVLPSGQSRTDYVVQWAAHDPGFLNLDLRHFERAGSLEEAFQLAPQVRLPVQNLVLVDRAGHIGWRLLGVNPEQQRYDAGSESAEGFPDIQLTDPANQRIWSANNRMSTDVEYTSLGDGGRRVDGRAYALREALMARDDWDEASLRAVQLDTRTPLLERWHRLFSEALEDRAIEQRPSRHRIRQQLEQWDGKAAIDASAYLFVRRARDYLGQRILRRLLEPLRRADPGINGRRYRWEESVYRLLTERPSGARDPVLRSWRTEVLRALDRTAEQLEAEYGSLDAATWGSYNGLRMQHPLSEAMPWMADWLDMPAVPMPGDAFAIRMQNRRFGQSQRITVSPGREEDGFFTMPGGASEHFLSPFYRAGHQAWVDADPVPFTPGPARYRLTLEPLR